ncbi:MAG TPA: glycoside hydrolase family 19 protein [Longimicrobium sp.]|nr:glycoside hydrolase family 19 protein [Longimicrobium sp.]
MKIDRQKFYAAYESAFGAFSKPDRKDGMEALITAAEGDTQITDLRWLAYMLATVKHECADRWRPIEEFSKGQGYKYGKPVTVTDSAGKQYTNVYYGRGYVQLTWDYNYRSMGQKLGNRLLYDPSLALQAEVAYEIMSLGMRQGSFTGVGLSKYINADKCDYVNARRIINGTDKAQTIAGYAQKFESILRASVIAALDGVPNIPQPQPQPQPSVPGARFTVAASALKVHDAPDAAAPTVAGSPLQKGAVVQGLADQGGWKQVAVEGSGVTGWVSAQYLQAADPVPA